MSHMNKPQVDQSFEICRQFLKSAVPPCTATVDTPTHYECMAINGEMKHLFGYVVAHQHVITLGFNVEIPEEDFKKLIPERLRNMMDHNHRRLEIRNVEVLDLRQDIQDACNQLLYYYNQIGWTQI